MDRQSSSDLELASTDALVEELLNRFEHGVVSVMRCPVDDEVQALCWWRGNSHACAGLAQDAAGKVLREFNRNGKRFKGEER